MRTVLWRRCGNGKDEREGMIGLRCICEYYGFFLSSFSLFLFHFSIYCYFSFCFIILIENQKALRETSVVSEVKESRVEYWMTQSS
jgi:hypothetical protein